MPFSDLTAEQQAFVASYFRTIGRWMDIHKGEKAKFNRDLKRETAALYSEINALRAEVNAFAGEYPDADIAVLMSYVNAAEQTLEGTLEANRKTMKKTRKVPDFAVVREAISIVREVVADEKANLVQNPESYGATLRAEKVGAINEALDAIEQHRTAAQDVFAEAASKMTVAPLAANATRKAEVAAHRALMAEAESAIRGLMDTDTRDDAITLKAFESTLEEILSGFTETGDGHVQTVKGLSGDLGLAPKGIAEELAKHADNDFLKLDAVRKAKLGEEIKKYEAALAEQQKKLAALTEAFKAASGKDKDKLRAEQKVLKAHLDAIEYRHAQLVRYRDTEAVRGQRFLETEARAANAKAEAERILQLLNADEFGDDPELQNRLDDPTSRVYVFASDASLAESIARLKAQVQRTAARPVLGERIFPDEPEIMRISPEQMTTLLQMLEVSEKLLTEGRIDYASVVYFDANRLFASCTVQRRIGLPVPPMKVRDPAPGILQEVAELEARARDLAAEGAPGAPDLRSQAAALAARVIEIRDGLVAQGEDPDSAAYVDARTAIAKLRDDLALAAVTHAPDPMPEAAAAQATVTKVNAALLKLYKTRAVTATEEDRENGVFYADKKRTKPIPSSQILLVHDGKAGTAVHRIVTQTRKGEATNLRANRSIPRGIMNVLKSRADTLSVMAETTAEGCEDIVRSYREETELILKEIAEGGAETYKAVKKLIDEWKLVLKSKELSTFLPNGLVEVKAKIEKFENDYEKMLPSKALAEAEALKAALATVYRAGAALKAKHAEVEGKALRLNMELSAVLSESGLVQPFEAGAMMGEMIDGKATELLGKFSPVPPDLAPRVEAVRKKIGTAQEFFKRSKAPTSNMAGSWRKELDGAFRQLEAKTQASVDQADEEADEIAAKIEKLKASIQGAGALEGADLLAFLETVADKMADMARGVNDMRLAKDAYTKKEQEIAGALAVLTRDIKSKSDLGFFARIRGKSTGNDVLDQVSARRDAAKRNFATAKATVNAQHTYQNGIAALEKIESEIADLNEMIGKADAIEAQEIANMTVGDRIPQLRTFVANLGARIEGLTDAHMSQAQMSEAQWTALETQVETVKASLGKVTPLPDLAEIERIAGEIDRAIREKAETPTKAERIKLREAALKELARLQSAIAGHPPVALYKNNPFDGGASLQLMASAFHTVEVAAAACVSPMEKQ